MENVRSSTEAAQAIIVAAFLIGIGLLVLSALLNGLIFSQDLASRDDGAEERSVIEFTQDAEESVGIAMTGNRTTPDDAEDEFDDYMKLYETELVQRYTSRQRAVSLGPTGSDDYLNLSDLPSRTRAWAVGQRCDVDNTSTDCSFVNETADVNWQVVGDSDAFDGDSPYKLEFDLARPSSGDEFVLNASDGSGFSVPPPFSNNGWEMRVDNGDIEFTELGPGGSSETYSWSTIGTSRARIEVMNGSINGKDTIGGSPVDTKSGLLDNNIEQMIVQQGDVTNGTYDIRIDATVSESDINGPCNSTPEVCGLIENGDDRDLYNVGVVHEVSGIEASYVDGDISHTSEIDHTLEQEDMILEDR